MKPVIAKTAALKIVPAIRMLERGQYLDAHAELCRLTGYAGRMPAPIVPAVVPEVGRGVVVPGPQPKPQGRIEDREVLDAFAAANPWCWIRGCGRRANRPHHIRKRSDGGGDVWSNLFAACDDGPQNHHTGNISWHSVTQYGAGLYVCFAPRLARAHRELIVAALPEIETQVLAILNGKITVYPAEARALIAA